jgi:hypothetical protein
MPNRQNHRGAHPDDRRLFSAAQIAKLCVASEEAAYLLSRGYAQTSVVDVVGRRHQLEARQRLALQRCMCSGAQREERTARQVKPEDIRGRALYIDGFNLIIGLEVALSGGVLLRGSDGALRDLAGLRGSYRPVAETETALELLGRLFDELRPAHVRTLLDAPVSNSGRLKTRLLEHGRSWACPVDVELVPDPDRELVGRELVVSGDSVVLDTAASWVNLLVYAVRTRVPDSWVVDLRAVQQPA